MQISGHDTEANRVVANDLLQKFRDIPGAVDLRVQQAYDYPTLNVDVDRTKARQLGLTQQNVASNMLVSLSGSFQTTPSFWTDPNTGTQYNVVAQTSAVAARIHQLACNDTDHQRAAAAGSTRSCSRILPLFDAASAPPSSVTTTRTPVIDVYGNTQGTDLGFISAEVNKIRRGSPGTRCREGSHLTVRGQVHTMNDSFRGCCLDSPAPSSWFTC